MGRRDRILAARDLRLHFPLLRRRAVHRTPLRHHAVAGQGARGACVSDRRAARRRHAARSPACRMGARPLEGVRPRARRNFRTRGAAPLRGRRTRRDDAGRARVARDAERRSGPRRSVFRKGRRRRVSRVLGFRRRHGSRGVRGERQSRRLRLAARPRHRHQREDRARPLCRSLQLPWIQGAHRGAARRRRPPHLLRSCRGRVPERQNVSGWPLGKRKPHPARWNGVRLPRTGRSAHAGMGVAAGCETDCGARRHLAAEDHQRAAVVARRARRPRDDAGAGGARSVAGRHSVADVSRRPWRHGAAARAQRRQGAADLDRHRPHHRRSEPGRPRHRREPPRCVGVRRRRSLQRHGGADGARAIARRARQTRRAPEAHDRVRQLGCGGIHPHLVYGMGRRARARTDRSCSGVSERRHGRPGHDVRRHGGAVAQPGDQRIRGDGARRSRGVGRGEESTRKRIGLHRVPEFSRRPGGRSDVYRTIWRLPLDLRQPSVDGKGRRPAVHPARHDDASLGHHRAAARERRRASARLRGVCVAPARVRQGHYRSDAGARPRGRHAARAGGRSFQRRRGRDVAPHRSRAERSG